jgi:hypothetical protein
MAGRFLARGIPCGETEKAEAGHPEGVVVARRDFPRGNCAHEPGHQ